MFNKSFSHFDTELSRSFDTDGYVIAPCENRDHLDELRNLIIKLSCEQVDVSGPGEPDVFLNNIHNNIAIEKVNELRIHIYSSLNQEPWFRPTYFSFGKNVLEVIVGTELAMQNRININIMMPGDSGSNIALHSDTHSGESPFQCVMWLPLTDVYDSKSIFLLHPERNVDVLVSFQKLMEEGGRERVMREIESDLTYVTIPYGSFILFSPNLFHGSMVNKTDQTRWSLNTRFKGLFTPYASEEKSLGSFYLPIRVSPATRFGLKYSSADESNQ